MNPRAPFRFFDVARFEDGSPTRWWWRSLFVVVASAALIGGVKAVAVACFS